MPRRNPYKAKPLTGLQHLLCDLHRETRGYWLMPCWIDVNMNRCAEERKAQEQRGEPKISYTAYVVKAIADAIRDSMTDNPEFNAAMTRLPWKRIVYFDRVHAAVTVERRHEGQDCFFVGIVPDADKKTARAIGDQLAAYANPEALESRLAFEGLHKMTRVPSLARRLMLWLGRNLPSAAEQHRGTFFLSSVGKYGVGMYLMSNHNLSFSFSEVAPRPVVYSGGISVAPMTTLTVVYDHRVMVGAPVARLMALVREKLERCEFRSS